MAARSAERWVIKVWELPVRGVHWTNFLAVTGLVVTGAYLHWPFLSAPHGEAPWVMGWMRLVHLILGWVLALGLLIRWYWGYAGNYFSSTKEFYPILFKERRSDMVKVFKYYAFLEKTLPPHLGHNALAALVYLLIFCLMWFQVVTGVALFSQYAPQGFLFKTVGRIFLVVSNGWIRLAHYFALWIFAAFFINHIYSMWISDLAEKDGTAGSIFSGYKYGTAEEFEDFGHRPWKSRHERRRRRARGDPAA